MRAISIASLLVPFWLATASDVAYAQAGPPIPWNKSLTITRTSSDEDIKNVLRSLLQANGLSVIFSPNVGGRISFRLDKVPIDSAFDQLVQEHNLAYTYNPDAKTVNITTVAADAERAKSGAFVPLDQVTYEELLRAIANFGDARAIAAQFAVISLTKHSRRAAVAAVLMSVISTPAMAQDGRDTEPAARQIRYTLTFPAPHTHYVEIDASIPTRGRFRSTWPDPRRFPSSRPTRSRRPRRTATSPRRR